MAKRVLPIFQMEQARDMGKGLSGVVQRPWQGRNDDRWDIHQGPPTRRWWKGGAERQGIGHSRGGRTTKIHAIVDALGNPIRVYLTGGQVSDYTPAQGLITSFDLENSYVIADKGYDGQEFVEAIRKQGGTPVIPSRSNARNPRDYDHFLYKDRNLVENFFLKLKNNRRIATRFEKNLFNFLAMVHLACILIWLLWYFANTP
jgi:transposase